jgi:poly-gamma-glutamate synthesis protein (capsule biosynthesis protein)
MTPAPEMAQKILEKVQRISKPFGTTISIENNVGVIRGAPG